MEFELNKNPTSKSFFFLDLLKLLNPHIYGYLWSVSPGKPRHITGFCLFHLWVDLTTQVTPSANVPRVPSLVGARVIPIEHRSDVPLMQRCVGPQEGRGAGMQCDCKMWVKWVN